jgi:hypothetical protein
MITNKLVKEFLGAAASGLYILHRTSIFYPAIKKRLATVTAKTADYTITIADLKLPTIFSNAGASGTIVFTLPAVAKAKGHVVLLNVLAAQVIRALPQTGEIVNYNGSIVVTKYLNIAGVIGNYAELFCDGTHWIVRDANGVVTKEP